MRNSSQSPGATLWFTGMSGAGKTTLSSLLAARCRALGARTELLDGDEIRAHLTQGLGFTKEDRDINVDRIGYLARLLARNGVLAITAAISPYRAARDAVRAAHEADGSPFVEIYAEASLETLIQRDVKGLYKRALAGEIPHFTGVSDPYEPPISPDIRVCSDTDGVETSLTQIWDYLTEHGIVLPSSEKG